MNTTTMEPTKSENDLHYKESLKGFIPSILIELNEEMGLERISVYLNSLKNQVIGYEENQTQFDNYVEEVLSYLGGNTENRDTLLEYWDDEDFVKLAARFVTLINNNSGKLLDELGVEQ